MTDGQNLGTTVSNPADLTPPAKRIRPVYDILVTGEVDGH